MYSKAHFHLLGEPVFRLDAGAQEKEQRSLEESDRWYDLQGNRINRPTKKGIYILRGQKVIVK